MKMKLYERLRVDIGGQALFQPAIYNAGAKTGGWLGMTRYEKVLFVVPLGAAKDAASTILIQVLEATDNIGSFAQVLKAADLITAGPDFAIYDELVLIHVETPEMSINDGYTHLTLRFTISPEDEWAVSVISIRSERDWLPHEGISPPILQIED